MHTLDLIILGLYLLLLVGIGVYFLRRQRHLDEFFVGGRTMGAGHIGLSVVATDVGGGFSIGLGGLGFSMGLSGSWLLFSGLIGAWSSAVVLIPVVKRLGDRYGWYTYPMFLEHQYDGRTRLLAAVISSIGYAGFVGAQILAGAKLAAVAFDIPLQAAIYIMATVVVLYTAFGGLEAVIYTDVVQWIVILVGLLFVALPLAFHHVGGLDGLRDHLPAAHLQLTNIPISQFFTWMLTIIPIWYVGMTLYQRIYAVKDLREARRAWFLAGLLEYPLMAFVGALLGLHARVLFPGAEAEMGLPLLIRHVLPVGVVGLVLAAYFSAIMSTADSCLLAAVGNLVNDIYQKHLAPDAAPSRVLALSRYLTVILGGCATLLAHLLPQVLDLALLAYSFMVSGLFIPTVAGLYWSRATPTAAFWSIALGGGLSVVLHLLPQLGLSVAPIFVAMPCSALTFLAVSLLSPKDKVR